MIDVSIPFLLVGIGVLIVVLALAVVLRQLLVSRQSGAFECSVHRRSLVGSLSWQHGLMRFGTDRLRWFRAFSLRLRPELVIRRSEILDVSRRRLQSRVEDDEDSFLVTFQMRGGGTLETVVDLQSGAALNAWLEAAPTGLVLGDTD